jgi:hypothetical protein
MSAELTRLHAILDALEKDPSWPWPPIDRACQVEEVETIMDRYPHHPSDLYFADTIYSQLRTLSTVEGEREARERTYEHLVKVHQWADDRALHASVLAMEITEEW